jgi:hypothetical protein
LTCLAPLGLLVLFEQSEQVFLEERKRRGLLRQKVVALVVALLDAADTAVRHQLRTYIAWHAQCLKPRFDAAPQVARLHRRDRLVNERGVRITQTGKGYRQGRGMDR